MFLRVIIVSLLLGASVFLQVRQTSAYFSDIQTSHYVLIASVYFLTFIYIILLKTAYLTRLAYAQLLIDTFLVTAVIYATGGNESFFSFLYILTIINASMLLYRRGGLVIASSSSILYGVLLDLHYYQMITPFGALLERPTEDQGAYILFRILVHTAAFYLVAMLSSFLSEQTRISRDELEAKKVDLSKLEVLNERIVQSIASGLITVDEEDRVILFNPAAEAIFGIPAQEANGRVLTSLLPFLRKHVNFGRPHSSGHAKTPAIVDIPFPREKGRELFLRLTVSPLSLPGGQEKGRILVFQDLTEIKRIEREMQRVEGLAMVGELAAGIAHEIRNPMASISGSIQVLKEGLDLEADTVSERLMDIVMREVSRLNNMVNDFLRYARPQKTSLRPFELNQLILDSLDLFKHTGGWIDRIRVNTRFREPLHLESDPEQIKQVCWNLFLNARDAMPEGGCLTIQTRRIDEGNSDASSNDMAELVARDTGEGFSEQALQNLFTPFFTTKEGGSGLGLATVKRIVESLHGRVEGANHPEGGALITLQLPLAARKTEEP